MLDIFSHCDAALESYRQIEIRDYTGTVYCTVPPGTMLVRSDLETFFVPEAEHAKHFLCS